MKRAGIQAPQGRSSFRKALAAPCATGLAAGLALFLAAPAAAQTAPPETEPPLPRDCEVVREADPKTGEARVVRCKPRLLQIVGGLPAPVGLHRWQAEIYSTYVYTEKDIAEDQALPPGDPRKAYLDVKPDWERRHRCGGVYLGEGWVLTAAHCVTEAPADYLNARRVRLGVSDLQGAPEGFEIERAVVHAGYRRDGHFNDIALLKVKLDRPDETLGIRPARLIGDRRDDAPVRAWQRVMVTGWGGTAIREGGPVALARDGSVARGSRQLKQVELAVLPPAKCEAVPAYKGWVNGTVICAGSAREGEDSCNGDSGGPLRRVSDGALVGIVSWGKGCGLEGVPGIYTRISSFKRWIERAKQAPAGQVTRM